MISLFKPKISVKTHIGYFQHTNNPNVEKEYSSKDPYLFITIRNNTKNDIIIYDIVQQTNEYYCEITRKERPLPCALAPGKSWEIWTIAEFIPISKKYNIFNTVSAYISSNGKLKLYKSKFDKNCPKWGPIPDGSY